MPQGVSGTSARVWPGTQVLPAVSPWFSWHQQLTECSLPQERRLMCMLGFQTCIPCLPSPLLPLSPPPLSPPCCLPSPTPLSRPLMSGLESVVAQARCLPFLEINNVDSEKQTNRSCFPLPPWSAMGGALGVATDPSLFRHLPVWEVDQPRATGHR